MHPASLPPTPKRSPMIRPMFVTALALLAPCNLVPSDEPPAAVAPNPPGETCSSSSDCGAERVCVEARCRSVHTSIGGELLAASGRDLFLKGDPAAAFESYREAISA